MKTLHGMLKQIAKFGLILMMGVSMSACSKSWREEVQLHDGSKIIVERYVDRGGRHEIRQLPPIKEQSMSFTMPSTNQTITWEDHYSEDVGSANFLPMLLDIRDGMAYLVVYPMGCQSYNKWGRPNPPYVVFKHDSKEWKRIPLQELPTQITAPNLIFSMPDIKVEELGKSLITAEMIKSIISEYKQPEYRTILREALPKGNGCTVPTVMKGGAIVSIAPVVNGQILYYNWWPLATDWLKSNYGGNK